MTARQGWDRVNVGFVTARQGWDRVNVGFMTARQGWNWVMYNTLVAKHTQQTLELSLLEDMQAVDYLVCHIQVVRSKAPGADLGGVRWVERTPFLLIHSTYWFFVTPSSV